MAKKATTARKRYETKKRRVDVYFEREGDVQKIMRGAQLVQGGRKPNISRYVVEATMERLERDLEERKRLAAERRLGVVEHTA